MNLIYRIMLTLYAFCLTILSLLVMFITLNHQTLESIHNYLYNNVLSDTISSVGLFIIGLIFFILSMMFLLSGVRGNKERKSVSKVSNIGEIRISLNALENIALNTSRRINGIKDTKAQVTRSEAGICVTVKTDVMNDVKIPELCEEMQQRIKQSIEESAGVTVDYVRVLVDNIQSVYKPRVE